MFASLLLLAGLGDQPPNKQGLEGNVVITGNRDSAKELSETPADVSVIDRKAMDKNGLNTAVSAAQESPGAAFQETNPGAGLVMLRGMVGPDVLIVLDGLRYSTSTFRTGPNQYLGLLGSFALDRVEVMQGPSSVLYGNGAIGGVVHMETRRFDSSKTPGALRLELTGMGANGGDISVLHQMGAKDAHVIFSLHRREVIERNAGTGGLGLDFVPLANLDQSDVLLKGFLRKGSLRLDAGYLGLITHGGGRLDRIEQGDLRRYNNQDHFLWLRAMQRSSGLFRKTSAFAGVRRLSESILRDKCLKTDGAVSYKQACLGGLDSELEPSFEDHLEERRFYDDAVVSAQLGMQTTLRPMGKLRLIAGFEWADDSVNSEHSSAKASDEFEVKPKERGNYVDGSRYHSGGAYALSRLRLFDAARTLDMSVGLRYSVFGAQAPSTGGLDNAINYEQSGLVGSAKLILHGKNKLSFWAGVAQGFRAPNLQESTVLGDTGSKFEIPNADLGPQRSQTAELGLRDVFGNLRWSSVAFFTALKDLIDEEDSTYNGASEVDGAPVVQRVNQRSGEYYGLRGRLDWRRGKWSESHQASWVAGEIERKEGWTAPRRLPPIQGLHRLAYDLDAKLSLGLGMRWAWAQDQLHPSDRKDLRICTDSSAPHTVYAGEDCPGTPAWYRLDLSAAYRGSNNAIWRVSLENASNRPIRAHGSGTSAPGMTALLSFQQRY
jgi:hemoglobin/transferrin/lactoferrin receptor protein